MHDRSALFFVVILPVVVIVLVGSTVTDDARFRVGVVDGTGGSSASSSLIDLLADDAALDVSSMTHREAGATALRRGELDVVVLLPPELADPAAGAHPSEVTVLAQQVDGSQRAAATAVAAAIDRASSQEVVARLRQEAAGGPIEENRARVAVLAGQQPPLTVARTVVDAESGFLPGGFATSVPTMLVLFVFITAVTGSSDIIEGRRLGIYDRVLAGPVTPGGLVLGGLASLLVAAGVQAGLIVGVGTVVFGVEWGDWSAATALVVLWVLVATGAGVLAGTVFRTTEQATSIGVTAGMVAGMLGGCMWPLEIVPPVLRTIGHLTPHAWAIDGWVEVLSRGGGLADIATELAVLAAFAAALAGAATVRLRTRLGA